jgi:hypothetical protein
MRLSAEPGSSFLRPEDLPKTHLARDAAKADLLQLGAALAVARLSLERKSDESDASGNFSLSYDLILHLREKRIERIITFVTATNNTTHVAKVPARTSFFPPKRTEKL